MLALRPLVALGEASFAFYMVHMIVMRALRFHFGAAPGVAVRARLVAGAAPSCCTTRVEIPMRRRLLGARRPLGHVPPRRSRVNGPGPAHAACAARNAASLPAR